MFDVTKCIRGFPRITITIDMERGLTFHEEPIRNKSNDKTEDYGFLDWFNADVSHGFHVFQEEEITNILKYKCDTDVFDASIPIVKMFFYQSGACLNIEVDLNNPLHVALKWELDFLARESGKDRKNALARIRRIAKKMGLTTHLTNGRSILSTDLKMVWRDENGNIAG